MYAWISVIVVNVNPVFTISGREDQDTWYRHVINLCFEDGILPSCHPPTPPVLGAMVRDELDDTREAEVRCPPPDTSLLDGSPPPTPSRDATRFDFQTYEWLERCQHQDARRRQYWVRVTPTGLTPTEFHDWDVVDDRAVQVTVAPTNLRSNQQS
jgi:hypothetical protein